MRETHIRFVVTSSSRDVGSEHTARTTRGRSIELEPPSSDHRDREHLTIEDGLAPRCFGR